MLKIGEFSLIAKLTIKLYNIMMKSDYLSLLLSTMKEKG